jgi:hypothetical protein
MGKGKLGILEDKVVTLDQTAGQRASLRLEKGVTICGRRMRSTHLSHVYVEWSEHQQAQGTTKQYTAPPEERELESMRLEWSYQRGRDDYMLRRNIRDTTAEGCWTKGTLMELRQSQAAGMEGLRGIASYFGVGHLVVKSGRVIYGLQQLVKNKQREEHGTARLLLQCSGGVCHEGYFLLPFNE